MRASGFVVAELGLQVVGSVDSAPFRNLAVLEKFVLALTPGRFKAKPRACCWSERSLTGGVGEVFCYCRGLND